MKYFVTVKTRAQEDVVTTIDDTHFSVSVRAAPFDGQANEAVRRALSRHLRIPPTRLIQCAGKRSKQKVFELAVSAR